MVSTNSGTTGTSGTPDVHNDPGFPMQLAVWGICVGLLLTLTGAGLIILYHDQVPQALAALTMCVGFGIVLAAFGSKAFGNYGGFAVAGAAAVTIVLFLIVQRYIDDTPSFAKRGEIEGDFSKVAELRIIDEDPLYTRKDRNTRGLRFIVLNKRFSKSNLTIEVETVEKGPGKELFQMTAKSEVLALKYLKEKTGIIEWKFDYSRREIRDGRDVVFSELKDIDENIFQPPVSRGSHFQGLSLINEAAAQDAPRTPTPTDIAASLRQDEVAIRRNARDQLVSLGASAAPPMIDALRANPNEYRIQLGVSYALAAILRKQPESAKMISTYLRDTDFNLFIKLTSDVDPTLRLQATEFLYRLGDARSIDPALDQINRASPNGASNSALIVKGAYQNLSREDATRFDSDINAIGSKADPKSRAILDSFQKVNK